jgi:hypothetical protein
VSTFAVVSSVDHLPRLLSDLAALWQVRRRRAWARESMLMGVWIEHRADAGVAATLTLPGWLASSALWVTTPLELCGIWAVCTSERPDVSRAMLLHAIVDACRRHGDHGGGRFVPVFPESQPRHQRHAEWRALATRHPGIVLPPLEQSRSGVITFTEPVTPGSPVGRDEDRLGGMRRPR